MIKKKKVMIRATMMIKPTAPPTRLPRFSKVTWDGFLTLIFWAKTGEAARNKPINGLAMAVSDFLCICFAYSHESGIRNYE